MNKRIILFISVLGMSFCGFQCLFSYKNMKKPVYKTVSESIANSAVSIGNMAQEAPEVINIYDVNKSFNKGDSSRRFVLQNDFFQIVFVEDTASIEEINLIQESESNQKSIVKEIGFDKNIIASGSSDAEFPLRQIEGVSQRSGGYSPLLRRGLTSKNISVPEQYRAFTIKDSRDAVIGSFSVVNVSDDTIVFENKKSTIRKEFSLKNEKNLPYLFELKLSLKEDNSGLWMSSGIPEVELMSAGSNIPSVRYRILGKRDGETEKLSIPRLKNPVSEVQYVSTEWIMNSNGYFGVIINPTFADHSSSIRVRAIPGDVVPSRLCLIDANKYAMYKFSGIESSISLPSSPGEYQYRILAGPLEKSLMKKIDNELADKQTGRTPNYSAMVSFKGFFAFISEPFASLLFAVMKFFFLITNSWGISIILLTIFLRVVLYPLNAWSIKSMRRMQMLSPYIQNIQNKYKNDQKKAQMEIMGLYKENKVNPFTGCIPMLIQIPFLIAMFDLLKSSFLLRGASFIPGWIDNLTAPDVILRWSNPIMFVGTELHLLPLLLGAVMFLQQKVSSMSNNKGKEISEQQKQQKNIGSMMTILFAVMFYNFPSGLNLYWLFSMMLGVLQQWAVNKYLDSQHLKKEIKVSVHKK